MINEINYVGSLCLYQRRRHLFIFRPHWLFRKEHKDALNNFYTVVKAELLSFSFPQPFSKTRLTCRIPFDKST